MKSDYYVYPKELYCIKCNSDVRPIIENKIEEMARSGEKVDISYKVAVCPNCRNILCDRDLSYGIVRFARKEGNVS